MLGIDAIAGLATHYSQRHTPPDLEIPFGALSNIAGLGSNHGGNQDEIVEKLRWEPDKLNCPESYHDFMQACLSTRR